MPTLTSIDAPALLLPVDDVDTDRIIPARFLTTTERRGLGVHLFADWRYELDGTPKADFALNTPAAAQARILVAGRNFGCGSSREHAPWALADFGFQAVVAPSFADIFRSNALKNGLVPVALGVEAHAALVVQLTETPGRALHIDVAAQTLTVDGESWPFPLAPFARHCLLEGIDELGYLLGAAAEIDRYESAHPGVVSTIA